MNQFGPPLGSQSADEPPLEELEEELFESRAEPAVERVVPVEALLSLRPLVGVAEPVPESLEAVDLLVMVGRRLAAVGVVSGLRAEPALVFRPDGAGVAVSVAMLGVTRKLLARPVPAKNRTPEADANT